MAERTAKRSEVVALKRMVAACQRQTAEWQTRALAAEAKVARVELPAPLPIPTEPTFRTKRLRVWEVVGVPAPSMHVPRRMYLACLDWAVDWPGVIASCSVLDVPDFRTVDWLEVVTIFRRRGLGTELLRAIEARVGKLTVGGATREGTLFCAAWMREEASAPHRRAAGCHPFDAAAPDQGAQGAPLGVSGRPRVLPATPRSGLPAGTVAVPD